MKSCSSFVGLLAVANSDPTSRTNTRGGYKQFHRPVSLFPRGGASSTQINLSATATMASLFAGSVGGAIGVGVSYPFDTLSTKAQVSTGAGKSRINVARSMNIIWKNEGIRGFFEGVLVTVRHIYYVLFLLLSHVQCLKSINAIQLADGWSSLHKSYPIRCERNNLRVAGETLVYPIQYIENGNSRNTGRTSVVIRRFSC